MEDMGFVQLRSSDLPRETPALMDPKQMKTSAAIIISLLIAGLSHINHLSTKASTIEYLELAKRFENGDANCNEERKCRTGTSEMAYER